MPDLSSYTTEELKAEIEHRENATQDADGRFTCVCMECGKAFKTRFANSNICNICYRDNYLQKRGKYNDRTI